MTGRIRLRRALSLGALVLVLAGLRVHGAEPQVLVTTALDQPAYAPGDTATAYIMLTSETETTFGGFQLQLAAQGMELTGVTAQPFSELDQYMETNLDNGMVAFCTDEAEPLTLDSDQSLGVTARFTVLEGEEVSLAVEDLEVYRLNGTQLSTAAQTAQAAVTAQGTQPSDTDPVFTLVVNGNSSAACKPGGSVAVELYLKAEAADSVSVYGMQDYICFDPDVFTLADDSLNCSVGSATAQPTDGRPYQQIYFNLYGSSAATVSATQPILSFTLQVKETASGRSEITHMGALVTDAEGNTLPSGTKAAAVQVQQPSAGEPLVWSGLDGDGSLGETAVLTNLSDETVAAALWLAEYTPAGRLQSLQQLSQLSLAAGAAALVQAPTPEAGTAKLLVLGEDWKPLAEAVGSDS